MPERSGLVTFASCVMTLALPIGAMVRSPTAGAAPRPLRFGPRAASTAPGPGREPRALFDLDRRALFSRADLHYDEPVSRSEEGIPIGNGRMGSLVWTSPTTLRLQINRVDVYPMNKDTHSFFERNSDYCCGIAFVDLDLGGSREPVFPLSGFAQHLSVYDGRLSIQGKGVDLRVHAWPEGDVIAIELVDRRTVPEPVHVNLRMLRFGTTAEDFELLLRDAAVRVRTRSHTATTRLMAREGRIALQQQFREGDYANDSAAAIGVVGGQAEAELANAAEARLSLAPGNGRTVVLIASASSFDPKQDVVASAEQQLDAAVARGYERLAAETEAWWHDFWSRSFVSLHSEDGTADFLERSYNYFLYLMAASSRGRFPPKFNGMLWNTHGDARAWGSQHWFANLSCYYEAIPTSNRLDLMSPVFEMYSGMYDACTTAARQQWGSQGLYIPETTWFDGLAVLPEDVAAEMRELYLLRKPWDQRSPRFREFAATQHPHSSRWNWMRSGRWADGRWVVEERGAGPYGPVTHIFGTTAKVAYLYWRQYEFTRDDAWLRERAYPMLRGAAELYRNLPTLRRGEDGLFHLHHSNSNESVWGARDTDEDVAAMRGVLAATVRASELLATDAPQRAVWRELLAHLPPLPTSDQPQALRPADYSGPRVFVRGMEPAVQRGQGMLPDANSLPAWFFDLCNPESPDADTLDVAQATFASYFREGLSARTPVAVLSKLAIAAATLGRPDAVRILVPNQMRVLGLERDAAYKRGGVLANRLTLREGHEALDAQRLGRASEALQLALLQSGPGAPGGQPVLRVFPAWPREWDAAYTLRARGAFLVTASMREGRIELVEIVSLAGSECRLRNPWPGREVVLHREGKQAGTFGGALLTFATRPGERLLLITSGTSPESLHRRLPAAEPSP
jgi:hypothetical protein